MKQHLLIFLFSILTFSLSAQGGSVSGNVSDEATGETLIGATVMIQGTTQGTITDFDGNYLLKGIAPGDYNLIISYISYEKQLIRISVRPGENTSLDVKLKSMVIGVEEVTVTATRKTDTEAAIISTIKNIDIIANGISADQISKSQDSDAAQVMRRVPGITITDGKFVVVRGLIERYNSVLLNGSTAPSFEADKRAFSFDAVPSGMIDNILIYKSPAPELPADFSGAAINIITRNNADENSLKLSYSAGYRQNATFNKDFQRYKGGKLDWLGVDDGTRAIPEGTPNKEQWSALYNFNDFEDYLVKTDSLVNFSRAFNTIWSPVAKAPLPDQSLSLTLQRRFLLGRVSVGNITALSYRNENNYYQVNRREYSGFDVARQVMLENFNFSDLKSVNEVNAGLIHNWNFIFGNNQKLEFNNFVNNIGENVTSLRSGVDNYDGETLKSINLWFRQRFVYSGQLSLKLHFNDDNTNIHVFGGYSHSLNNRPDDRRLFFVQNSSTEKYYMELQSVATNVKNGGRLYIGLDEAIANAGVNFEQKFRVFGDQPWSLKAGFLYDMKVRDYGTRLLGVVTPTPNSVGVNLYLPVDSIMQTSNFYFDQSATPKRTSGLAYKEGTKASDSYSAEDRNIAAYLALKVPFGKHLNLYGGVRMEHFTRNLYSGLSVISGQSDTLSLLTRDTINFFPSANLIYTINERNIVRASYGLTTNRPEFREMSSIVYEDFDMNVLIHGNPDLLSSYTHNYDLKYEFYPNLGEMLSVSLFYKHFINPIELFLFPSGTGYDYVPFNTEEAYSAGIEMDARKTLSGLANSSSFLRYLKDFTVIFNSSLIMSVINTNKEFALDSVRIMQGQSPTIVNLALYYKSPDNGWMASLTYNRIGRRIAFAGSPNNPHTWELPRNSLDLTVSRQFGRFELKAGVKDLLNSPVRYVQYYGENADIEAETYFYHTNRKFTLSAALKL
ncbi:MAG: TonB-dependent receptor domain-containing protein [Bacteroidota bacterium]